MSMHLLVIIIWLAWSARNIELSKFMAAVWAVFFVARIWGRCRSRCLVFCLGLVVVVACVLLWSFRAPQNRAKIVRKSCGATGAACSESQKHNGCVQFLSCENRANRLLYLFPGRLMGGLFVARDGDQLIKRAMLISISGCR